MKKKVLLLMTAFVMCAGASFMQASPSYNVTKLPTSGEYYLIKNTYSNTYIGGANQGTDNVKHEDAVTNKDYHVFLVTGDNTNGWTFQQVASGMYVTHDNNWTGSYAEATDDNLQLFQIDNETNSDFCSILKKKDDGTFANGIGYDSSTPGSTLYFDKGTTAHNEWLFQQTNEVPIILYSTLTTLISDAQALQANVTTMPEAEQEIGTYSQEKSEALTAAINAVTATATSTTKKLGADIALVRDAFTALKASKKIIITTNTLPDGEYYIKVAGQYYLNNPGIATLANTTAIQISNQGLQEEVNITGKNQIFKVSKVEETGRYSIYSTLDETGAIREGVTYRHINEAPQFRDDWGAGDNTWRTMNIHYNGTKYAIQNAESAGTAIWTFNGTQLTKIGGVVEDESLYIFEFIPVADIEALQANNPTSIENVSAVPFQVLSSNGGVKLVCEKAQTVKIYNITGQLVKQVEVAAGETTISLLQGIYIINGKKAIVK